VVLPPDICCLRFHRVLDGILARAFRQRVAQRGDLRWFFSSRIKSVGLALNSIVVFLARFHQNWYE